MRNGVSGTRGAPWPLPLRTFPPFCLFWLAFSCALHLLHRILDASYARASGAFVSLQLADQGSLAASNGVFVMKVNMRPIAGAGLHPKGFRIQSVAYCTSERAFNVPTRRVS